MKKYNRLIIPNTSAFVASFCIMVIEIIASRIIARYLGSSLFTWTAVIGIVLLGIAVGNYIGGVLADRFQPRKILSLAFIASSITCVFIPFLNKIFGEWYVFWLLPLQLRIFLHILGVFSLPSTLLGVISPLIAKFALDFGFPPGRTVGNVYACSAAGSILGTFITGFYLIPFMGTVSIIITISIILGLFGLFYMRHILNRNHIYILITNFILGILILGGFSLFLPKWRLTVKQTLRFMKAKNPFVIYQKESGYSFIEVEVDKDMPNIRRLVIDKLLHSVVNMEEPANLDGYHQYSYIKLYAGVTHLLADAQKDLRVLIIGGGGYVFPRYIKRNWPNATVDVVEIDPEVTKIAYEMLGFSSNKSINIYHMDARNFVDEMIFELKAQKEKDSKRYDFIFCDAISGLSVPYQLTTYEFNQKIHSLLSPNGVYMLTVIDNYRTGRFLGSIVNTFSENFSNIYCFSTEEFKEMSLTRNVFVVIGSKKPIDFRRLDIENFYGMRLTDGYFIELKKKSKGLVLTDDYAPVDYLLIPVVRQYSVELASGKFSKIGDDYSQQGLLERAIVFYKRAIKINPENAGAYNNLGTVLLQKKNYKEAKMNFEKAVRLNSRFAQAYNNLGTILTQEGDLKGAIEQFKQALTIRHNFSEAQYNLGNVFLKRGLLKQAKSCYEEIIKTDPEFAEAYNGLGNILLMEGSLDEAMEYYRKFLTFHPDYPQTHNNMGIIFAKKGKLEKAIFHFRKALAISPNYKNAEYNLKTALKTIQSQKDQDKLEVNN